MATDNRFALGWRDTFRVLRPYFARNLAEQVRCIWFIVLYLILFQLFVLELPIVYAGMIIAGIVIVAFGLMFFMEGLRLGLMPLGEVIGSTLPQRSNLFVILGFAFLLGVGATFAEPAIAVLKAAGSGVIAEDAPLLYSILNDFADQLVACVGFGVGLAVLLGVLRFFYNWPLKRLAIPSVTLILGLSLYFSQNEVLADILGLAWDCGAVTTGPVTVPLVLALGIGVCRVLTSGTADTGSGFGIVTLASLFPILAVLLLSLHHYHAEDYYGAANYEQETIEQSQLPDAPEPVRQRRDTPVTSAEFNQFVKDGVLPEGYELAFVEPRATLKDGSIVIADPEVRITKQYQRDYSIVSERLWNPDQSMADGLRSAMLDALRAIVPLCAFLFIVLYWVLRERLERATDVTVGITFALLGMALFSLGIALGLTPLGGQLGGNIPLSFAEAVPWGGQYIEGPYFETHWGKLVAVLFAFFLGYGATLAEPALNALGDTVERITIGAFRKRLLMQSVAIGVGLGIAAGIVKVIFNLPLMHLLAPAYLLVLVLTVLAPNNFVNFSWDSAGVTTGPITVPLVLAMGLGVGANVPGVSDGFGILALASVGPILTVLSVGLYTQAQIRRAERDAQSKVQTEALSVQ
ncbi:MAG: DUF1538 domain-containing protein [Pseudomonadota bacterium]